nr:ABC transporter ATP-binding protein [uncultured Clostridium sp.]
MKVEYRDICVTLGGKQILNQVNVLAESGKITGVIGPNGCGKSTLLKTTLGIYPRDSGDILLNDSSLADFSSKQLARLYGYVGQENSAAFDFSVYDIVAMAVQIQGRKIKRVEKDIVMKALEQLDIAHICDRNIQNLSGGEKKMVFIARAFAQGVDTIILDEPTNHLDIKHQLFILDTLKRSKKTILIVLHDLRLAAHYCDRLYLVNNGCNICNGTPEEVLKKDIVERVFGVNGYACEARDGSLDFTLQMN